MLNFISLIVLFINTAFAERLNFDQRRSKIISIVDEELAEVTRLARQQDQKVPDTLFRISELNLEKARIYRETENEKFLSIKPEARTTLNKREFFKYSEKFFLEANESALLVAKKFPNYKEIGEVYYILAFNYKELGNDELAKKYFKLASGKVKDPQIANKSKVALADYYFNEKKYQEAIPYYESSLKNKDDKWWTKDAFNLAWCYYRVKNFNSAINLMKDVHKKSGGKFVDMRGQVERDIGIFYVDANRLGEGINFFEKIGINYTDQFIQISTKLTSQGRFDLADSLLKRLHSIEKNKTKKIQVLLAELYLYDKFNKEDEHLLVSSELVESHLKLPFEKSDFDKLIYQVNKKAAEIQKALASDIYKSVPKIQKKKARLAMSYFELSGKLDPAQMSEKIFFQGETAFIAGNFEDALKHYLKAFDSARSGQQSEIMKKSSEGMLACIGNPDFPQSTVSRYYVQVYSRYLLVDSRSQRASSIYVKLFNSQYDVKDISGSEETLTSFAKSFPSESLNQEGMLAKIMEHYRKSKDYDNVKKYVRRINSGEFKVSTKYADALKVLQTKIQIEGVQKSLEMGEKDIALKGYHQIYASNETTPKAKVNAAYNLGTLYFEKGDTENCYKWIQTALKEMDHPEVVRFADSILSMAAGLFLKQKFFESSDISFSVLTKLCRENSSNKDIAFKNAVFISLANEDLDKALEVKNTAKLCSIPESVVSEVSVEILKDLSLTKRWEVFQETIKELEVNSRNHPKLISPLEDLRKELILIGDSEEAMKIFNKQNNFYEMAKSQKLDIPVDALDIIAERMIQIAREKKKKIDIIQLMFPEENFNNQMRNVLQIMDQLASDVNQIQKIGSGKGVVQGYKLMIDTYEGFSEKLKNFNPPDKHSDYVESFKKAMADIYVPLLDNAKKQRSEMRKLIMENKILSPLNSEILFHQTPIPQQYIMTRGSVLMDRGGKR